MPSEQELIELVRAALGKLQAEEIRMFGGTGFMLNGHLLAAASRRGLLLRVGVEQREAALALPGTRPLLMRGRVMRDYLYADPPGLTQAAVREWIGMALRFVKTLPPKAGKGKTAKPIKPAKRNI